MRRRKKLIIRSIVSLLIIAIAAFAVAFVVDYDRSIREQAILAEVVTMDRRIFLENSEFSDVCLDGDTAYAGGTDGVFKINTVTYETEEVLINGMSFELVRAVKLSEDGMLWIGHGGGLTGLIDDKAVKHYDMEDGLPDNRVNDIAFEGDHIYVATFGGVGIIEGEDVIAITEDEGLIKNITKVLLMDSKGNLWCGSYTSIGGGVTKFSREALSNNPDAITADDIEYFTTVNGLSHNAITAIAEDEDGGVWIGNGSYTEGGATLYTENQGLWKPEKILTMAQGLIGEKVRYIYSDSRNNIWYCSENDGIAVIKDDGNIKYLTQETGLSDNEVKKMIMDVEGNLWLASRRGITVIDTSWLQSNILD